MELENLHIKYLRRVLYHWTRFCSSHVRIKDSIEFLLLENERLKKEIEILRNGK